MNTKIKSTDYVIRLIDEEKSRECIFYNVQAFNEEGEVVGEYDFKQTLPSDEPSHLPAYTLIAIDAETEEEHRRRGVATKAYCFIEDYTGLTLYSQGVGIVRTQDGNDFWSQPNRPFGNN